MKKSNSIFNAPIFAKAKVKKISLVATDVYSIVLKIQNENLSLGSVAGQFFMLKVAGSCLTLARPISLFDRQKATLEFLVLQKGCGTKLLCHAPVGLEIEVLGPLGKGFPLPLQNQKVCIIGGGIGVAPVAFFASTLKKISYDFFACFKNAPYGLEHILPDNLFITTQNGNFSKNDLIDTLSPAFLGKDTNKIKILKGMLPTALDSDILKKQNYDIVYACGPVNMLKYVQQICKSADVKCFLSMENKMACGVGACLGCTIQTTQGQKRCCRDGPVFLGASIIFCENKVNITAPATKSQNIDISCDIAGQKFCNPVIAASGTFGYGSEYSSIFDVNLLGGICSKGLTLHKRAGNAGTRLQETAGGLMNSIGLENPGVESFCQNQLPKMLELKPVTIVNLAGSCIEDYAAGAAIIEEANQKNKKKIGLIELNISCPNVKAGGVAFGLEPKVAASVLKAVKDATSLPIMAKLTPNSPCLCDVAQSVIETGAKALSLVNTFNATYIDINTGSFVFDNKTAGLSGPAIMPLALRCVLDVATMLKKLPPSKRVPIVGMGGIKDYKDAIQFIMAGCTAVQVGTATFGDPLCMIKIIEGIKDYMAQKGFMHLSDFRGCVL